MAFKSNVNAVIKSFDKKLKPRGAVAKRVLSGARKEASTLFIQFVLIFFWMFYYCIYGLFFFLSVHFFSFKFPTFAKATAGKKV